MKKRLQNMQLIAEFDNWRRLSPNTTTMSKAGREHELIKGLDEMKYDTSWDELMPVAKKAYDEVNEFLFEGRDEMRSALAKFNIDMVYQVTVKYITIINKNK